jgi:hypothetical protein
MRRRLVPALLAIAALAGSGVAQGAEMKERRPRAIRSTEFPRPLDPDIAVGHELAAARRAGTRAAYTLFIERHPGHKLAEVARRELAALAARARD